MTEKPAASTPPQEDPHLAEINNLKRQLEDAQQTIQEREKSIRAYQMREKRTKKPEIEHRQVSKEEEEKAKKAFEGTPAAVEEEKPHYVGSWQHFCPTCGDINPDFKDETKCKRCGMHLGAKKDVEKLKACPNCGSTEAEAL